MTNDDKALGWHLTADEISACSQALNEVLHGPNSIKGVEFATRMGVERDEAERLLDKLGEVWAEVDNALTRATEIFLGDLSDDTDAELGDLLPALVAAGYAQIDGESPSGHFWRFTPEGVARQKTLRLL